MFRAALFLPLLLSAPALAQTAGGTYTDWQVFTREAGPDTICYAITPASESAPSNVRHGEVYFLVASWESGAATEQPSLSVGYDLKTDSPPTARVGSTRVDMYASENEGFVESASDERRLVQQMRRGSTLRVDAVSQRGTATSYEFSLSGVTAALRRVRELCA